MLAGFKAFLMRGNVIDLAVAVVIGAAFTNIVNSIVKGIINPLVGAFGTQGPGQVQLVPGGPLQPRTPPGSIEGIPIMWGTVLSATLTFLITAAVVYFLMVLPMSRYLARRARQQAAKEEVQEVMEVSELEVLKEIRDTLVAQRATGGRGGTAGQPRSGRTSAPAHGCAQMWWGGFSSRKRARSAALSPPVPGRSPQPRSVSSEDCWSSGSSKISAGFGRVWSSGAGALILPAYVAGCGACTGHARHGPRARSFRCAVVVP